MKKIVFSLAFLCCFIYAKNLEQMHKDYMVSMEKMHSMMDIGIQEKDPDVAFVAGMLPHHVGAVDMANIVLEYGEDESIKKLARDIIKAQEEEIKFMQEWLDKKGFKYSDKQLNHKH